MTQIVVKADAEALTRAWLLQCFAARGITWPVKTVVDRNSTQSVTLFRTGGPQRDQVTDGPQLTIECRDESEESAGDMARLVNAFVHAMEGETIDGHPVYEVQELTGVYNNPDPRSGPRYSQNVIIAVRSKTELL